MHFRSPHVPMSYGLSNGEIEDLTCETELDGPDLCNEVAATFKLVGKTSAGENEDSAGLEVLDDHLGENEPEDEEIVDCQYMSSNDEELQDARKALK
ncbi:conserved hypothetical protein [Ricinus communis]|uniref:Uncharacterized protein n=1 Tax=Ricinus communis TaxID=3988 RepID=B9T637_RICCO|nr:conserved hypothetical protein [Ricinus communis]